MRIGLLGTGVHPIPPVGYGGVERTLAEYSTALRAAGHQPIVLNAVRKGRSLDEYWFSLGLPKLLKSADWDVLHASTPVVANRLAQLGHPYVFTSHSRHWFDRRGVRQRWGHFLDRRAVRDSSHTVALTDRLRRQIRAEVPNVPEAQLTVIPIGVDAERFRPEWDRRTGKVALGVGVVASFKRWHLAASALRGTGITLRIAGPIADSSYADQVRAAGDSVELLGEVTDEQLRAEYARGDLLLHPSRVELLAGVVLQGLAAGMPVLGASPVAELIPPGAGAAAPEGSDEAAIVAFLRNQAVALADDSARRRAAGDAGRTAALERYSWASVVRAHEPIYERLRGARPN